MSDSAVLSFLADNPQKAALYGCTDSYLAWIISRLTTQPERHKPLVVITSEEEQAQTLARELSFFIRSPRKDEVMELPATMHFVQVETSPYTEVSPDRTGIMQRLAVLFRLSQGYCGEVLVASAAALRRRVIAPEPFGRLTDLVAVEEEVERDDLVKRLIACGFNRVQVVEDQGTFAVRGGIIDLYPPLYRFPVRVEFFGDLVESIRLFDPDSQRTLRSIDEVIWHPVRETIRTGDADVKGRILRAADQAKHPSHKTRQLLDELEQGREFFGVEALTPAFHPALVPLIAYLPPRTQWVLCDPEAIYHALKAQDERSAAGYQSRLSDGRLTFSPTDFFVDQPTLEQHMVSGATLEVRLAEADGDVAAFHCSVKSNADVATELRVARSERGEEILNALARRLRTWQAEQRNVLIAAGGPSQVERLHALLKGYGIVTEMIDEPTAEVLQCQGAGQARVMLCPGELSQGFRLAAGLVVLTDEEVFGPKTRKRPARRMSGLGISDFGQLQQGDAVVHSDHGVGLYRGLQKLEIQGAPADYLLLEYAGNDRLYVPVYRMNLVQKFVGADGAAPKLDRLGGVTWQKKQRKVRLDVRKMAEDLLQLYAQRAALEGHAYPAGDAIYSEFEATFPFTETPDQLQAVDDIMQELTSPQPMDRLICGDVGFGKTEVALRAAFLVAMSGKQVAVLAPTTVLVEQHQRSFADRLNPYPLNIESLSRFRTRKEQTRILSELAAGKLDIVIGTHRLLQSDVRFRDLGLIVVDEEHRFGVAHKERLKRLRTQVDVLSMTATPIPRSLHMGMMGMRSISIIATPPVDRLAIRTYVCRFDEAHVAEAIRKELARGGQVFFVHNRVQNIEHWAEKIADAVPEAKIAIGHGQMDPRRLEQVMVDFVAGKYDILVCTTIIESGLDIPRANTMFINQADRFGLSQLYQLRGRIGRSKHRAYCYLLVPGFEAMTGEARQRLAVLQRFTELGSGFSIASHDLEIRGAGELLGAKQSGHIAAVGFENYARILEEAVAELKGEPIVRETDPEMNTHMSAFIPDDYIEDTGQRLDLYKRLSHAARDENQICALLAEATDRYGPPPQELNALGELMVLKGLATKLGATVVDLTGSKLSLTLSEVTPLKPEQIIALVKPTASPFRLTPEMRLIRKLHADEQRAPLDAAKKVLHELLAHAN